jgi:glycosyltransferase involved in cell wall biosynthesis
MDASTWQDRGRFAFVIPAYNHSASIEQVIADARPFGFPIFLVDDGSTDGFDAIASRLTGVTVLRHPQNRGKGAALLTGFAAAAPVADWAISVDADGQHNLGDLPRLLAAVSLDRRTLVIGSRVRTEMAAASWARRFGGKFSNFWVWLSGGPELQDTQSGFRIYPLPDMLSLPVRSRRYQFEVESLVVAHWRGLPFVEVPIGVTYHPKAGYVSHFRPFVDFWRNGGAFFRLIGRRLTSSRQARARWAGAAQD